MALIGPRPIETVGKLPEIRHQPGMRIRREPRMLAQFMPEILQMLLVQPPFQKRAPVDARRGVALEVDQVARLVAVAARGRNG